MDFSVGLMELVRAGGPVLLLLIGLSIYTVALAWQRYHAYKRYRKNIEDAKFRVRQAARSGNLAKALENLKGTKNPVYQLLQRTASAKGTRDERRGLSALAIDKQINDLQRGMAPLGTIGSISPFIGLFGTILGVMRAFRDLAAFEGAGPAVVAVGISEALVATAAGLFVAIPAIVGFNYFSRLSNVFQQELTWLAEDMLEHLPSN